MHMADHFSVSSEINRAIAYRSNGERTSALRDIISKLSEPVPDEHATSTQPEPMVTLSHQQNLARIYDRLHREHLAAPINELDVIGFANNQQLDHIVCVLARLTGLPTECIELAFAGLRPDLLLTICRMHNFAWSTLKLLLDCRKSPPTAVKLDELCDEYHGIPLAQAQRFGRFLNVHFRSAAENNVLRAS